MIDDLKKTGALGIDDLNFHISPTSPDGLLAWIKLRK